MAPAASGTRSPLHGARTMKKVLVYTIATSTLLVALLLPLSAQGPAAPSAGPNPPQTPIEAIPRLPVVTDAMVPAMLREIAVPDEFDVTVFATPPVMNYPTAIAPTPDGSTLYVGSDGNGASGAYAGIGRILRLRDT